MSQRNSRFRILKRDFSIVQMQGSQLTQTGPRC